MVHGDTFQFDLGKITLKILLRAIIQKRKLHRLVGQRQKRQGRKKQFLLRRQGDQKKKCGLGVPIRKGRKNNTSGFAPKEASVIDVIVPLLSHKLIFYTAGQPLSLSLLYTLDDRKQTLISNWTAVVSSSSSRMRRL